MDTLKTCIFITGLIVGALLSRVGCNSDCPEDLTLALKGCEVAGAVVEEELRKSEHKIDICIDRFYDYKRESERVLEKLFNIKR